MRTTINLFGSFLLLYLHIYFILDWCFLETVIFEAKTSIGALSKNFVGIGLDWRVTLGSVMLIRIKSARVTAIWIGDRYMR